MAKTPTGKTNSIKGEARELILDSAERLFAEQGVEAVSLRAINAAAGVSPGVLHYHFGNREALVCELINRRMQPLMYKRRELITPLLASEQPAIEDVVRALVMPLAEFVLDGGEAGQRYLRINARLYAERSPLLEQASKRYLQDTSSHFPALLKKSCPQLSHSAIIWRLAAANNCLLQTLVELTPASDEQPLRGWIGEQLKSEPLQPTVAVEELVSFISGGFKR